MSDPLASLWRSNWGLCCAPAKLFYQPDFVWPANSRQQMLGQRPINRGLLRDTNLPFGLDRRGRHAVRASGVLKNFCFGHERYLLISCSSRPMIARTMDNRCGRSDLTGNIAGPLSASDSQPSIGY